MMIMKRSAGWVAAAAALLLAGCGYTTRPGLPSELRTVYVAPFANKINLAKLPTNNDRFPIYRHAMETDLTNAVVDRYQFTGLLRPAKPDKADTRVDGELVEFRRDALRYNASQQVEEWRLNLVVNLKFTDLTTGLVMWEETNFTGDTTFFALGANAESEEAALDRAITDLARRIVERSVEAW
jgi:Lipopolysaccharide-assembly